MPYRRPYRRHDPNLLLHQREFYEHYHGPAVDTEEDLDRARDDRVGEGSIESVLVNNVTFVSHLI